jgi:hypothetical protein
MLPVKLEPVGLRPVDAAQFIGISTDMLDRCRNAEWVTPAVAIHGLVIYDTSDLRLLWNRIKREGLPGRKASGGNRASGEEPLPGLS